jgi:two-component system chemotaxis response regulator CheB
MPSDNIRVLIVDDSAVMRAMISDHIEAAQGMSVAGIARNGHDALEAIAKLRPDVVTLDMQMPGMNGLEVLDTLLETNPLPVLMVSALTRAGAAITLEALERGASDYVAKPERGDAARTLFEGELIHKIRTVAGMNVRRMMARRRRQATGGILAPQRQLVKASADNCPADLAQRCIALGISTGGPPALTTLLGALQPPMPPMVIVQHMPPQFTGPLAVRLNSLSALSVREAVQGDRLQPNLVLVAPGGQHVKLRGRGTHIAVVLNDGPPVSGHKPSVDVMMKSAAEVFGPNCLGVIMTGMGRDGADGCRAIRAAGGYTLGQDQATSDVYGMNRVAFVEGNIDRQFGLQEAATLITRQVRRLGNPVSVS